jgi:tRNA 2-thiouridine synthesizing protein A
MKYEIDKYLDTSGLLCPEPVMMLHKMMREAAAGEVIEVTATDPSTTRDIPKFCHFLGHELLEQLERDKTYVYYLRKVGS